jgi:molybdate transport system substrate-binding protein
MRIAASALLAVLALACALRDDAPLRVGAAASLREAAEQIAARYREANPGAQLELAFGASSELAAQLRAGAPLDLLLSADAEIPRALEAERQAGSLRAFASNRLVVVATPEAAPKLAQPADLAGPAIARVALPAPAVPVGHYAREWLSRRGLLAAIEPRVVQTENVRAALAAVEAGHADASVVYATDARIARSARVAFEIPGAEQPRIVYMAAVSSRTQQPEAALRFLGFVTGAEGAAILRAAGFGPPGATAAP